MSRSGSLFLASILALTASMMGACDEPEPDPGAEEPQLIAGQLPDETLVIGGISSADDVEVISGRVPSDTQIIGGRVPGDAQIIGGMRPVSSSTVVLDPGFQIALPGAPQVIGGMRPRTYTPVRMIPTVSDLQVGCLDGGKQLLVRANVHGPVDSAFVELQDGDATDGAMLDRVTGTIRYAIIPLDDTSALRCDRLDHISSAVVTLE